MTTDTKLYSKQELYDGIPMISTFAKLSCDALIKDEQQDSFDLNEYEEALLFASQEMGSIFVDTSASGTLGGNSVYLAVMIDEGDFEIQFQSKDDWKLSITFLHAFQKLCSLGLVTHHFGATFCLSLSGIEQAELVKSESVQNLLDSCKRKNLKESDSFF